jgi:glutathione peroxidase
MQAPWMILATLALSTAMVFGANPKEKSDAVRQGDQPPASDHSLIPFKTIDGQETNLAAYKGKVVLVVNVASKCGFTPQYKSLEALYEKYKDRGFVILGFPANNYGGQEPGTNQEIKQFCTSNFSVTFPMMSKVSVNGKDKHPLFVYLTEKSGLPGPIKWNFSKFLMDRQGRLVARYPSEVDPLNADLVAQVEKQLE